MKELQIAARRRSRCAAGQALSEYLVCTTFVALALAVPLGDEGPAGAQLLRACADLLRGFAWLVAIA